MISAVIPVYNHELYLADAIHSCLICSEVSEILIADDGSTDGSREIIRFFAEKFPGKIRDLTDDPATNVGAHNRINRLCAAVRNEWIAILNSDDRFESGRFRNFKEFVRYTGADLVFGNCAIIDQNNALLGYKYALYNPEYEVPPQLDVNRVFREELWLLALLNQNFIATTSNMVFRKALFEDLKGFAAYRYIHDWDFMIRAAAHYSVAYNPNMWTNYRIHPSNTISESTFKVKTEVQKMMANLLSEASISHKLTSLYTSDLVEASLKHNKYLNGNPIVAFVLPEPYHPNAVRLAESFPNCKIVENFNEVSDTALFLYAPTSSENLLEANDLRNLILAAVIENLDFCICSLVSGTENEIIGEIRDTSIWRPAVFNNFVAGRGLVGARGKVVRIPRRQEKCVRPLEDGFSSRDFALVGQDITFSVSGAIAPRMYELADISPRELVSAQDGRPVIFVFPAVIAVGGAENVLIEVMKQLSDEYRFVIICTEALTQSQGSWVGRALEHAEGYFDLTTLSRQPNFMSIVSWLKAAYSPKMVFLTNGSTWQVHNAWMLRKLFRDVAIVDQQVYDAEFGWVEWLKYPSVRTSDRFIAVTKRIEKHFLDRLHMERSKVDLIPHPINSERIVRNLPQYNRKSSLEKFGLSTDLTTISFVGRMTPQKRPWLYLALAARAKRDKLPLQFVMAGQGDLSESISNTIDKEGLDNVVRMSNVDPLEELYAATDLLVITSEYEGVPLAMLEAMGAGVPVFSTDVGDIAVVLRQYHSRQVYPVDAHIDDLYANFVEDVSNLPMLKEAARNAADGILRDYSGQNIAKMYKASFEKARSQYLIERSY